MPKPESKLDSPFAQAWLEAEAHKKAEEGGTRSPRKHKRNGRERFAVELTGGAVPDFRRERANLEAEEIAEEAVLQFGASRGVFDVRKPTVHVQPPSVVEEQRRLRELPGKLTFNARKLGRQWGDWIDRSRKGGPKG